MTTHTEENNLVDKKGCLTQIKSINDAGSYLYDDIEVKDEFNIHTSIVQTLAKQIKNIKVRNVSFVFGLFGKWGSGKSFIVNELKKLFAEGDYKQLCFDIDVWKYNGQPLLRVILLDILQQSEKILDEKKYKKIRGNIIKKLYSSYKEKIGETPNWKRTIIIILILSTILISANTLLIDLFPVFINNTLSNLTEIGIPVAMVYGILQFVIDKYADKMINKFSEEDFEELKMIPAFSPEQFEDLFDELITAVKNKKRMKKCDKVVLIFDNIDRCQPKYAYETLTCIKTYLNKRNFVYIIPCDDEAIKKHLIANHNNEREFADDFIDKIFQTSFRIPKLKEVDTDAYIAKLLNEINILELSDENKDNIRAVLYHAYKGETPRQIKKFINDFRSYYYIAKEIDTKREFLLDNIGMFTIMIAIKQKFTKYEEVILDNNEYIKSFYSKTEYYENKNNNSEMQFAENDNQYFIDKNFGLFLHNVSHIFDNHKSLRNYIYLQKTSDELLIYNSLRDGTTKIETIDSDNVKVINKFFDDGKCVGYVQNVQRSILNYVIDNFDKAKNEIELLATLGDKKTFMKNIKYLITHDMKLNNEEYTLLSLLEELDDYQLTSFIKILKYFKCSDFAKSHILHKLFLLDSKKYLQIFSIILDDSLNEKNIFYPDDIGKAIVFWNFAGIKHNLKEKPENYTKFANIIREIVEQKRYDVINGIAVTNLLNNIDDKDRDILPYFWLIMDQGCDVDITNKRLVELCKVTTPLLKDQNTINQNIDRIDFIFKMTTYSTIDNKHESWPTINQFLVKIIQLNITQQEYIFNAFKTLIENDINIDNYIINRIDPFIRMLIAENNKFILDKIINRSSIWPSVNQSLKALIISSMDLMWIGIHYDTLLKPFIRTNYKHLIDNYNTFEDEQAKKEFKTNYSDKISSECIQLVQKFTQEKNAAELQNILDIIKLVIDTKLHDRRRFKQLIPYLKNVVNFNDAKGFELCTLMMKNGILITQDIIDIIEDFKTNFTSTNKPFNIDAVKNFISSLKSNTTPTLAGNLNSFCQTSLFDTNRNEQYFQLGKFVYLFLKDNERINKNLENFPQEHSENPLYNEFQRQVFRSLIASNEDE